MSQSGCLFFSDSGALGLGTMELLDSEELAHLLLATSLLRSCISLAH